MKRFLAPIILCLTTLPLFAQQLPTATSILANMELANKYFMDKWPDPTTKIVTDKTRPSNLWTRATYYEGLMALYNISPQSNYYKYAVDWGTFHKWLPTYSIGATTRNADNQCCGQTYIELYQIDNKIERITPIKACIDEMVNSTISDDWWWIDAIQMAMPIFAKFGVIYNDDKYYNKMYDLYSYTRNTQGVAGLYNQAEDLWWRDNTFDPPFTTPNGEDCYWSRGNGWVIAALTRVLDVIPANAPHRDLYLTDYKDMCAAIAKIQRPDGFWNVSLDDELEYPGKELSGTAFFCYAMSWGINKGLLDKATYQPIVIKAWNGMVNDALHTDGFLGYVQGTGKQPSDAQPLSYTKPANFEDYGLGAFLLAGHQMYKMASPTTVTNLNDETEFYVLDNGEIKVKTTTPTTIYLNIFDSKGVKLASIEQNRSNNSNELNLNIKDYTKINNQLLIITLTTENSSYSKRIILH